MAHHGTPQGTTDVTQGGKPMTEPTTANSIDELLHEILDRIGTNHNEIVVADV
jgi:hypothetical protein